MIIVNGWRPLTIIRKSSTLNVTAVLDPPLALYAEIKGRAKVAGSSYSATTDFLQYIYFVFVAKCHQKIRSRCLVDEVSFTDIF